MCVVDDFDHAKHLDPLGNAKCYAFLLVLLPCRHMACRIGGSPHIGSQCRDNEAQNPDSNEDLVVQPAKQLTSKKWSCEDGCRIFTTHPISCFISWLVHSNLALSFGPNTKTMHRMKMEIVWNSVLNVNWLYWYAYRDWCWWLVGDGFHRSYFNKSMSQKALGCTLPPL